MSSTLCYVLYLCVVLQMLPKQVNLCAALVWCTPIIPLIRLTVAALRHLHQTLCFHRFPLDFVLNFLVRLPSCLAPPFGVNRLLVLNGATGSASE